MKKLTSSTLYYHKRIKEHIIKKFHRDLKILEQTNTLEDSFLTEENIVYKFLIEDTHFYVGCCESDDGEIGVIVIAPTKFPQIWCLTTFFQKVFLNGEKTIVTIDSE